MASEFQPHEYFISPFGALDEGEQARRRRQAKERKAEREADEAARARELGEGVENAFEPPEEIRQPVEEDPVQELSEAEEIDEEAIRAANPDFPHRPIKEISDEPHPLKGLYTNVGYRKQHLANMVTILHHSLLRQDFKRAGRAFALILRSRPFHDIKAPDLRVANYWGIGAEILLRGEDESSQMSEDYALMELMKESGKTSSFPYLLSNMRIVKDYYERLMLQYPDRRQSEQTVSAVQFNQALIGLRIAASQEQLARAEESSSTVLSVYIVPWDRIPFRFRGRSHFRRRKPKIERSMLPFARIEALRQSRDIADTLADLLISHPYSDSLFFIKTRAMLHLWIAELICQIVVLLTSYPPEHFERAGPEGQRSLDYWALFVNNRPLNDVRTRELETAENLFLTLRDSHGYYQPGYRGFVNSIDGKGIPYGDGEESEDSMMVDESDSGSTT